MTFPQTDRTKLKRLPKRGHFDRETVYAILDEGFICHVGFVVDGQPFVIPTGYARAGDTLYIHGSLASRMLRSLASGIDACVTVTIVDGLVLARSAFHQSMNYRSGLVFGRATIVDDPEEKYAALTALSEHIVRGRWADVREPNEQELKLTTVGGGLVVAGGGVVGAVVGVAPPLHATPFTAKSVGAGLAPVVDAL